MRVTLWAAAASYMIVVLAGCTGQRLVQPEALSIGNPVLPSSFLDGESGQFSVDISGGAGPYTVFYTFTGGATDPPSAIHTLPAGSTYDSLTVAFNASAAADIMELFVFSVTDALGTSAEINGSFIVPRQNAAPILTASSTAVGVVTVQVDDPEGDDVTVRLDTPEDGSGLDITPGPAKVVKGGHGEVTLTATPNEFFGPTSGKVDVLAGDVQGNIVMQTITMTLKNPEYGFTPDTLYAIPLKTTVHVGEPLRVLVATGAMANPFYYMSVRITLPAASGVDTTEWYGDLNVGAPGGIDDEIDGIWTGMGLHDGDFWSWSMYEVPAFSGDIGDGLDGLDFGLAPLGGHDLINGRGSLFSFEMVFANPGTWHLGFQQTNVVNRTYYQDDNQAPDYFWSDISNNTPGIPNSVTVIP